MYKQYKLLILKKAPPPVTYKQTNKKKMWVGRSRFFLSTEKLKSKK